MLYLHSSHSLFRRVKDQDLGRDISATCPGSESRKQTAGDTLVKTTHLKDGQGRILERREVDDLKYWSVMVPARHGKVSLTCATASRRHDHNPGVSQSGLQSDYRNPRI